MDKVKIKLITIGHFPVDFNKKIIEEWTSDIFEIGRIENFALTADSDAIGWVFTDELLKREIPNEFKEDCLIAIVNVPLELNWFCRRIEENKVVFTFHEMKDILIFNNIPIENIIYRVLYAYTLVYKSHGNRIPDSSEFTNFTHDETRGCLFDMNGIKYDVIHSCHNPTICADCIGRLKSNKVSVDTINKAQNEIKKIRKTLFYRIADLIKQHQIWAIIISSISAIILGALGSILGPYIYELFKNPA